MLADNIEAIRLVANRLGALADRVVFLGGAVVGLLVTEAGASRPRSTRDVDIILEVASWAAFYYGDKSLRAQLIELGFREDLGSGLICRWMVENVTVDIMDPGGHIAGFTNRWYPAAVATARGHDVGGTRNIRLISPACFLATKLEAFASRGGNDYQASQDIEDVVSVIDGRVNIEQDVRESPDDVRRFIASELRRFLMTPAFEEALPGHLGGDVASQARWVRVRDRLVNISLLL